MKQFYASYSLIISLKPAEEFKTSITLQTLSLIITISVIFWLHT